MQRVVIVETGAIRILFRGGLNQHLLFFVQKLSDLDGVQNKLMQPAGSHEIWG